MSNPKWTCTQCPYLLRHMVRSGRNPEYEHRCAHPDAPRTTLGVPEHMEWMNMRRVNVQGAPPYWCPLVKIDET